ncbi:MAG: hypothetical protein UIB61_01670 [Treponema sp.]|jgi:hypothetical protein|nr:hypothetical protein [Treponema sp.]
METPFLGELLIIFLILLNCVRIFLLKFGKIDSLTILAPISVVLAILQIFAWNVDIFSLSILAISIFCFFTNFRAFLRFSGGLYVDHYSVGFKIGTFFVILLCLFEGAILVKYRPVFLNRKEFNIVEEKFRLSGDFSAGFEKSENFVFSSAEIRVFSPVKKENFNGQSIILISDKRADSVEYVPYMKMLAAKGFKVYSGDFYARDGKWFHNLADFKVFRKFFMQINYFQNPVKFEMQKEFYSFNEAREIRAMLDFVSAEEKTAESSVEPIFVVGDWMSDICFDDFSKENLESVSGFFKLSDLTEYSSKGFGFVQQTSPFTARFLNLEREPNLGNLTAIVEKTLDAIPAPLYKKEIIEPQNHAEEQSQNLELFD